MDILRLLLLIVTTVETLRPDIRLEAIQVPAADTSYRLPKNVRPLSYDVYLKPEFQNFTFEGDVKITVEVLEDTSEIILHTNKQNIRFIMVSGPDTYVTITRPQIDYEKHFLIITIPSNFSADTEYNISITFTATLSEDMSGFYRSSYSFGDETRWLAATQFEPTHARSAFPCFDEPEFKAKFKITIDTPKGYHSLSNMPQPEVEQPDENGWTKYEFEETQEMSTYLVAFIVSDFNSTDSHIKYNFTAWARPNAIDNAAYSQTVGPQIVEYYEEYTGIAYTFPKIDQVAVPDFSAGAMENWGLITYRETGLLYYEGVSTESNKKSIAMVIAHELAHMWFGNLVTLQWWDYTWLNEGFARLFQYLAMDEIEPDWHLMEQFVVDQQHAIFANDALQSAQSLTSESNTPAEISAKFGTISYSKGASVLRMLSHILTPNTFRKGLRSYLSKHQWNNTEPKDLFDALEQQRIEDNINVPPVQDFFEPWTTQPGYPVINVTITNGTITVTQERFLLQEAEETEPKKWYVPLTWTTKSQAPRAFQNTRLKEWIFPNETDKELPNIEIKLDEWIIFNNLEAGYYRVNYDNDNWNLIIKELQESHNNIPPLNRAQLLDDALNLARAGKLPYSVALDLTMYLEHDKDYIPWAAALNALSFLDRRLSNEMGYDNFQAYVKKLLANVYGLLGFEEKKDDTQVTLLHRVIVVTWVCRLGLEDCVKNAVDIFSEYEEKAENNPIPANLRSVVYCTALEHGDEKEWNFLWDRYKESITTTEQVTILSALGCTKNVSLLTQYLAMSIDENSGIRKQDAASVYAAVYSNPDGVETAFNFLTSNFRNISEFYGGMNALSNIIIGIAGRLTTENQVDELESFINGTSGDLGSAAEAGRNAVEAAKADINWTKNHRNEILDWLQNKPSGSKNIATNTIVITVAFIIALLYNNQIFNYIM